MYGGSSYWLRQVRSCLNHGRNPSDDQPKAASDAGPRSLPERRDPYPALRGDGI